MNIRTLSDLDLKGQRVFVRADLNVPLDGKGEVMDETRIQAILPTLRHLADHQCPVILASHLGRPKGPDPSASLVGVAKRLAELIDGTVLFPGEVVGERVTSTAEELKAGEVLLLENLRFHPGEKGGDPEFARALRDLADIYVNDAFGTAHRKDTSTYDLAFLFEQRAAGLLIEKEVAALSRIVEDPERPFVAIVGGAKISGKLEILKSLIHKANLLLVGGGLANTFLAAKGYQIGKSLVEEDLLQEARNIMALAQQRQVMIRLPTDAITTDRIDSKNRYHIQVNVIPVNHLIADIGEQTVGKFQADIARAKTVFWNGPMGIFEKSGFAGGTRAIAKAVAACEGFTVVGGGESVAAVHQSNVADRINHISTGGGASLEFIAGNSLPALEALAL
ncbi:MAG TPA: phosphoglycerate kinase [Thermoanaerobaculia bacterium]|nr:phosphoglycerate kinase [Thermoanaerobaculia bacterium]HUM28613.1 phosphoglycerate kinase [Thermoanaerobaculia bacterium]HXK66779.1 phosphoglycerate kinase [Thermoanaerobaculia bacterium]